MIKEECVNKLYRIINEEILNVRKELAKRYNTNSRVSMHYKYRGLYFEASRKLSAAISDRLDDKFKEFTNFEIRSVHGELNHIPLILSDNWFMQHEWCQIKIFDKTIYVDATMSQFQDVLHDLPDYCISEKKFKCYLMDSDNNYFKLYRRKLKILYKLYERLQYDVWGIISDIIHYIIYGGRNKWKN